MVGPEAFARLLPGVRVQHERGCLTQMMDAYASLRERANIVAVEEVPSERVHMCGVVGVGAQVLERQHGDGARIGRLLFC